MTYKFAFNGKEDNCAKAVSKDLPISTKTAIMLAKFVRGKTVERARRDLTRVLAMDEAVPFTRFTDGAGHKPGMGPGKYPQKATKAFLMLVNSAAANAEDKGLGTELTVTHVVANRASRPFRYGRHRGRERKSTHVEIVVSELTANPKLKVEKVTKTTPESKPVTQAAKKVPVKKAPAKKTPAKKTATKKAAVKKTPTKEKKDGN